MERDLTREDMERLMSMNPSMREPEEEKGEQTIMERKNAWKGYDEEKLAQVDALAKDYMRFLDSSKTERECVDTIVNEIEAAGYRELSVLEKEGKKLSCGDKVYAVLMNKTIVLFQLGTRPMTEGMNILGAHIDSPRLDVKQNPLYEDSDFSLLDTHYYGGVKKYQWVALPLAIHGVVVKKVPRWKSMWAKMRMTRSFSFPTCSSIWPASRWRKRRRR